TVEAGKTTGTVDFQTPANDVYNNGSTVSTTITGATGGNFEQLTPNPAPAETVINDSIDTVTVSIVGNGDVTEAQAPSFTVSVSQKLDHDLTVTLSNGATVVIAAGQSTATYSLPAQGDDVFKDAGSVTLGVVDASVAGKTFEDLKLSGSATVQITDTVSEVVATLTADKTTVAEGGQITYTVTLTNAQGLSVTGHNGLTFTLSDGTKVTVPANSASGTVTITANDDVYVGGQPAITNKLESVEGADDFEKLTLGDSSVTTTVTDEPGTGTPGTGNEGDKVSVTIVSNGNVTEDQQPSFTVKVSQKLDHDLTINLSNGGQVVIAAGQTEAIYQAPAQGDDVFKDPGSLTVGITDATVAGKTFENLELGNSATVQITDTTSEVVATLTADKTTVAEGGQITYTVTLTNAQGLSVTGHNGLTFTLSDGTKVTVPANSATGTVTIAAPDDVYVGGQPAITNKLESVEGADDFEKLTLGDSSVTTTVTDEPGTGTPGTGNEGDKVSVTIVSNGDVNEAEQPTFTVKVSQKLDQDLTINLSNGGQVVIAAGQTEAIYQAPAQGDDVFKDGGSLTVGITDATVAGKTFENLELGGGATVQITDTTSEVVATLTADKTTVAEGGQITYTVTLTNAQGLSVTGHNGLTFTLSDGTKVTVPANSATGTITITAPDDVYVGGQPAITNKLESVEGADNFEKLTLGDSSVTTTVTDEPGTGTPGTGNEGDKVSVTIVSNGNVTEDQQPSFTVKVSQKLDHDLTINLSNGGQVVIAAGQTEAIYQAPAQGDDVFKDPGSLTVSVTDATVAGKTFENLELGNSATVQITDTTSEVVATLTADKTTVAEGGQITYTVTLTNAQGLSVTGHNGLTFTLSDGTKVTVPANSASGTITITAPDDVYVGGQPAITNKLESVEGADDFEKLTLGDSSVTTTVTDEPGTGTPGTGNEGDKVSVTIVSNGDVNEAEQPTFTVKVSQKLDHDLTVNLSNGGQVVIAAGQTEAIYQAPAQGDDVFKDGGSLTVGITDAAVAGKTFENLEVGGSATVQITDTTSEVVATLTADKTTVAEGGQITYTVTLTNAQGLSVTGHNGLTFTLSDGTKVTVPANSATGTITITAPDDVYVGGQPAITNKLESVAGADDFEKLTLGDSSVTTTVTDEPGTGTPGTGNEGDKVSVTIVSNGDVNEAEQPTFTVKVSQKLDHDLTVNLSNGGQVVIAAGQTEAIYQAPAQGDDVFKDPGSLTVGITDAAVAGKTFENLEVGGSATVQITDTTSEVVATLTADKTTVAEGGQITYTVTLTNAQGLSVTGHNGLTFTLSDGTKVTVPANSASGTVTINAPDDVYVGGQPAITNKLESVEGADDFEKLTLGQDQVKTEVTDEPGTGTPGTGNEGDKVSVTIVSNGNVTEDQQPSFTVKVSQKLDHDLTINLSNGGQVVIAAGQTEAIYQAPAQGDDVFKDGGSLTVGITDATVAGKTFENLELGGGATVQITDTTSEVVATLTADKTTVAEGGQITYTVTLTNAQGLSVTGHNGLTFTLSDGTKVTVPANSATGTVTITANDDVYVGGQPNIVNKLESVEGADDFEKLTLGDSSVTTTVTDEPGTGTPGTGNEGDKVSVTIVSNGDVNEAEQPTFTVKVSQKLDHDLTVNLSNGGQVVIAAGQTEAIYQAPAQGDDVFKDGGSLTVGITDATVAGKTFENLELGNSATVQITDTTSEVVATLTADKTTVAEGGQITYTVTLTNAQGLSVTGHNGLTFTLSDGTKVTVPANSATGTVTITANDDVYVGGQPNIVNKIESVSGGDDFEKLTLGDSSVTTTVTDEPGTGTPGTGNEGDKVSVTIVSNGDVNEAEQPTFTVKVSQKLDHDLTINLSNGGQVVIAAGQTEAIYQAPAQGDDVFKDPGSLTVGITDATVAGKTFENLEVGGSATVQITDTTSEVVATLTADKTTVAEGGQITYTVTLTNAQGLSVTGHNGLTFTLSDGTKVTVPANSATGTVTITANDDVYVGGQPNIVNKLESVEGADDFEKLTLGDSSVTTTVTDEPGTGTPGTGNEGDKVSVTIVSNGDVNEAEQPTFTVKVSQKLDHDLTVNLSNGGQVVIAAGQTEAIYQAPAQGDDVFKDPGSLTVSVTDATVAGKTFENLELGNSATVQITDTTSEVVATLTADKTTVAEGGQITYTVTLTNAQGLSVAGHNGLTFTLSDGTKVTVPANSATGTITITAPDDVYVGGQPAITNKLESVEGADDFEKLTLGDSSVTTTVTDEPGTGTPGTSNEGDKVSVTIVSNGDVNEAEQPTFTVKVSQKLDHDLTVNLSNGGQVVIAAGQTEAIYQAPAQGDDVFKDGGSLTVGITDATVAGKTFENLELGNSATVQITDTTSEVVATLTADKTTVAEGGQITYTVTLTNAQGLSVTSHNGLTFTLSDGTKVTVPANSATGTITITAPDDVYVGGQPAITNKLESVEGADDFEKLTLGDSSVTTTVTDEPGTGTPGTSNEGDKVSVTIVSNGDVNEAEQPTFTVKVSQKLDHDLTVNLSNGGQVVIAAGQTEAIYQAPAQGDDVFKDGGSLTVGIIDATVAGKTFENLEVGGSATVQITDTTSEVVATLTADKTTVAEGGQITYTVTLTNAQGLSVTGHNGLTFTLSDGTKVTVPANSATGTITITANDDVYVGGQPNIVNKLESVEGADDFEKLTLGDSSVTTTVTDEPGTGTPGTGNEGDKVSVTIVSNGDVNEAEQPTFTVKVSQKLDHDLTVNLSNGGQVVIAAGQTEAIYQAPAQGDDVFKDPGSLTVSVTDATVAGKTFENLEVGGSATVQITDTTSEVVATLTADKTTVAEGGQITYTVTLTNAQGLSVTGHNGLTFTLSDGTKVTVPANSATGTITITAPDDVYVGGQPAITNKLESVEGADDFEKLTLGQDQVKTEVTDEPGTGTPGSGNEGDKVSVTIVSNGDVNEAEQPTFTVKVSQKLDHDLTVNLSNGGQVVIAAGQTEAIYQAPAQGDDVFKDGGSLTVGITDATVAGKTFENLELGNSATVQITDTTSEVVATLTADKTTVAEGGQITYTVTLTNAQGLSVTGHNGLTFTLSDGTKVTVPANSATGTITITAPDDVYVGGQPAITNKLESVEGADNFEKLTLGDSSVTTTVTDEPGTGTPGTGNEGDKVSVTIVSNGDVNEAEQPTFTVKVSQKLDQDLTINLSNGGQVVIAAGQTEAVYQAPAQGDDVFKDPGSLTVSVTDATVAGKTFENLELGGGSATVQITDTTSEVVATLTADKTTVAEGGQITYTVTLTNAQGLSVTGHNGLTFTLSDGTKVTVPANSATGTITITAPDDVYVGGQPAITNKLESVEGADDFEKLTLGQDQVKTEVTDEPGTGTPGTGNEGDKVSVTIVSNGNVTEDQQPSFTVKVGQKLDHDLTVNLSNGGQVVIAAGQTEAIYQAPAQGDDVFKDGGSLTVGITDATVTGKTFENLELGGGATVQITDTVSEVVATLTADKTTVAEGGQITYTVTLTNAQGLSVTGHNGLTFTLSDGTKVTVPANSATGTITITAPDDVYVGGQPAITNKLESVEGADDFEKLTLGQDQVKTEVTDEPGTGTPGTGNEGDKVSVTIVSNGNVTEDQQPSFTVKVGQKLDHDLTVNLSNGGQVVIAAGQTEAIYQAPAQGDDVFKDGGSLTVGITDATVTGKTFENLELGGGATVQITDTVSEVVATLTADKTTVAEGGQITYTVTLTNAQGLSVTGHNGLTFTLSDGTKVTVPANSATGTITITAPDDVYVGGQPAITNKLESVEGADDFEKLTLGQDQVKTEVTDEPGTGTPGSGNEGDKVSVTIVSNGDVNEAEQPTFTVKVSQKLDHDLTVNLSNGGQVVIAAGQTEAVYQAPAQGDDVFKDGGSLTVGITDATVAGKTFENLELGNSATVQITDTTSEVVATLTADKTTVAEGGQITYTVTLTNAQGLSVTGHNGLTFTLSDGTKVTVPANSASGTVTITANDDVYVGGQPAITNKLESVEGADDFEKLTLGQDQVKTEVTDEPGTGTPGTGNEGDKVSVTIVSNGNVTEDQQPSFTVKVSQKLDHDLTVKLSNGGQVVITAGQTEAIYQAPAQGDDVFKDPSSLTVGITDATVAGKTFENLEVGGSATVQITDTTSEVVATLTADKTTVAEGGQITYTVTLTNAQGLSVTGHNGLTFTLSDGTKVTVPASSATGTITINAPDDVYVGGQPAIANKLESVTGADNFEKLTLGSNTVTTSVTDEPGSGTPGTSNQGDKVSVTIVSNGNVTEDQQPSFTVKVSQKLDRDLNITLSNGGKVTILAGQTEAIYKASAQGDDVFKDPGSLTVGITEATVAGKTFENLEVGGSATVQITDTLSEVVATLTADKTTVAEGGQVTYTVTLTNAQGLSVTGHNGLTFTLSDGTKVTVPANSASGTVTINAKDDVYVGGQPNIVNKIESVSGGDNFEKLTLGSNAVTTTVTDEPGSGTPGTGNQGDKVSVTIVSNGDVNEAQQPSFTVKVSQKLDQDLTVKLSNGGQVVIAAGQTEAIYKAPAQGDDVFKDNGSLTVGITEATVTGKTFENLELGGSATVQITDTLSEVVATLTADKATVAEGGQVTYTVTLTNAQGLSVTGHNGLTFTLSDGTKVTIPANSASGTVTITAKDDVYVGGQPSIVNKIESVSGGDSFEKLTLGSNTVTTTVTDEPGSGTPGTGNQGDKVSVTIVSNGNVTEDQQPSFTVKVSQKLDRDLNITLSNGGKVTILAGQTEAIYKASAQGEDVFKDPGSLTVGITEATVAGKTFENLELGGSATVQITDTLSEVVATLSADKSTVAEGGQITYTVTLTNAQGLSVTGHNGLTFTLSDGTKVTIPANSASGTVTMNAPDDVYVGGQPAIANKLESVTGADNFEKLTLGSNTVTTSVTDEPGSGTPGTGNQGDKVSVTIVSNGNVTEDQQPSFTVKVNQKLDRDLNITLSNGGKVTILAGQTEAVYKASAQGEDVFKDPGSLTVGITDASVAGKTFENLELGGSATVQITDTLSEVVATLTADKTAVAEGGQITYTVTLTNAQGLSVTGHNGLTFTLSDGTKVTVPANSASGTFTITAKDDVYVGGQPNIVNKIESVSGGDNFEKLTLGSNTVTTTVTDEPSGQGDLTTVGISGDTSVNEGNTAHYTLTLSNPSKTEVTVTLSYSGTATNGQDYTGVVTVKIPAGSSSATFDIKTIDDQLVEGSENIVIKISGATGGGFENLQVDASKSSVTTTVVDNDHAPVSTGGAVTGNEDTDYVFQWSNFNVTDADGNSGLGVTITQLPDLGSLKFFNGTAWVDVSLNQTISQSDIAAGKLKFVPLANQSGVDGYGGTGVGNKQADYAQIKFKPFDGTNSGSEATLKVDINPIADKPDLTIGSNNVNSLGLTKETWTSLTGLGTNGNGITGDALKNVFANSGNASKSEQVTTVDTSATVTPGTGSKTSGLIYLEAGKTYTFSGTADDSLQIVIGGKNVAGATWGSGSGSISGSFTPTTSGYYTLEIYNANQAGPGSLDVNIKVGNGAVTDLNSANIPMYPNVGALANAGVTVSDLHGSNGQGYYDGYKLNEGGENGAPVKLVSISSTLTDTDGSESLSVKLSGIPAGSVVADNAGHTFTVGTAAVDVTGWNLGSLTIKPPAYYAGQFDVKVTSTSTESVGGSTATNEGTIKVTVYPQSYNTSNLSSDSDNITGTDGNDIVVADVSGLHVVPGQDYNIAFIVDTSGSMGSSGVNAAKSSLESVFKTLAASVKGSQSGTVNILLVDFATQVKSSVSVTLNDAGLQTLLNALSNLKSNGGTNYEDAFKTTANWFENLKDAGSTGSNQTYFITDGQPTYYQTNENTNPTLGTSGVSLDTYLASINYKAGMTVNAYINNSNYISIDSSGNLQVQYQSGRYWYNGVSGTVHAEGNGSYELSSLAGTGNSTSNATYNNSVDSFKLLSGLSNVEAIGLNNDVKTSDLKPFDSDGKPQTNIDPSNLADAILGHTEVTKPGDDTVNGGDGNDIIFGDLLTFPSVAGTGVEAIQGYVANKLGVDAGDVDARAMHKYISEHYTEFDVSGSNDGADTLMGGAGNDILFGQGGNDYLDGGKGNDILLGGTGNDTLIGGQGNDILIGGSGADTFVWKAGDIGNDVIKDFKAVEGDRLDLRDLLQGEKASTIDNFLKITTVDGSSTLQVSTEGKLNAAGGLANADVTIKLEGVNWSNTTVNSLISGADPTIKIDNN
ncbi:immunoglobulin-like domain-containing protein, partial [Pseudomonas sp. NPDC087185]